MGASQKKFTVVLPKSITIDNYMDLTKSIRELSHMWDEKR
jgi:hypothetical protein